MVVLVHNVSIGVFLAQYFGYVAFSAFLQFFFYRRGNAYKPHEGSNPATWWKTQPEPGRCGSLGAKGGRAGARWWPILPGSQRKYGRHRWHWLFASYNLLQASIMAGLVAEATQRRWNGLALSWREVGIDPAATAEQVVHILWWMVLSIAWQSVLEYIWHVTLHLEPLYSWAHRIHHYPRSPEPFDDLLIHPLEAFGYNCILFSPSMFS